MSDPFSSAIMGTNHGEHNVVAPRKNYSCRANRVFLVAFDSASHAQEALSVVKTIKTKPGFRSRTARRALGVSPMQHSAP
jgi:hypothetical protein